MNNNYIVHWGIPGMKWGVRRYQNRDGTLTAAGKARYDRDVRENLGKKKENRINTEKPDPNRWAREDINRSRNLVRESSNLVNEMEGFNKATKKFDSAKPSKKSDLSSMSDKEMRDKINRELLERQYDQLFSDIDKKNVRSGREVVSDSLAVIGATLGIASSSLGIALAIKELKG